MWKPGALNKTNPPSLSRRERRGSSPIPIAEGGCVNPCAPRGQERWRRTAGRGGAESALQLSRPPSSPRRWQRLFLDSLSPLRHFAGSCVSCLVRNPSFPLSFLLFGWSRVLQDRGEFAAA